MQKVFDVQFTRPNQDKLSEYVSCECNFCEKRTQRTQEEYERLIRLGHGFFYCPFCLRHHYTTRARKHVLLLDFKGVIGYYYSRLYPSVFFLSEIKDFVANHIRMGLNNPIFACDTENLLWFIDFGRVGDSKRKLPLLNVQQTVDDILSAFALTEVSYASTNVLRKKYHEAIDIWYESRKRPADHRILSPTLQNVITDPDVTDWSATRIIDPTLFQ